MGLMEVGLAITGSSLGLVAFTAGLLPDSRRQRERFKQFEKDEASLVGREKQELAYFRLNRTIKRVGFSCASVGCFIFLIGIFWK